MLHTFFGNLARSKTRMAGGYKPSYAVLQAFLVHRYGYVDYT